MDYHNGSNEQLLQAYQQLDIKAFEAFFRKNAPIILNFLAFKLRNEADADDALQKTFYRVHKYILSYDAKQNALNWVFTIARNVALDIIAHRHKEQGLRQMAAYEPPPNQPTADVALAAQQELALLLDGLEPADRKLIEDRFIHDKSYDQLASDMQQSAVSVRQRLSRLLKKVRYSD